MRKVMLLEALAEVEKDIEFFKHGLERARKQADTIRRELAESFKPDTQRYSSREYAEVRRSVVGLLAARTMHLREIVDALPHHDAHLIANQVHKLAGDPRSDVTWNGKHGRASKYGRV